MWFATDKRSSFSSRQEVPAADATKTFSGTYAQIRRVYSRSRSRLYTRDFWCHACYGRSSRRAREVSKIIILIYCEEKKKDKVTRVWSGWFCDSVFLNNVHNAISTEKTTNLNNNNNNNNNNFFFLLYKNNFIHRFKKIDYLQNSRIWILKYIPYVHSSCVRMRIVIKWLSKNYY